MAKLSGFYEVTPDIDMEQATQVNVMKAAVFEMEKAADFIPELGHFAFGQPWQEFEAPEYLLNALLTLGDWFYYHEWVDVDGYRYEQGTSRFNTGVATPFDNSGAHFKNSVFEVEAYSWDDDYEQPYNFKWRDLEVSWYKWLGRDTTCNRVPSVEKTEAMLAECLQSLGE